MNNQRFDDELLSSIIDGEADEKSVASVNKDPVASDRLALMRQGVLLVAEPIADADPQRRASSIAAAMAAATPPSQVTSLAAARHDRQASKGLPRRAWVAGAAAAVLFALIIPIASHFNGSDGESLASNSAETDLGLEIEAGDSAIEVQPTSALDERSAIAEATAAEDAEDSSFERADALEDDMTFSLRANRVNVSDLLTAYTVDEIELFITEGTISPKYEASTMVDADVNEQCLLARDGVSQEPRFDLLNLDSFAGPVRLIVVEFADDGTTRLLDAKDCAVLR